MSESEVFAHRTNGGGCYALMIVMLVFPLLGVSAFLGSSFGTVGTMTGVGLILATLASAAAVFFGIRSEYRLELGPITVRFLEQGTVFGIQRAPLVHWELPLASLTSAKQVNTRTPSSRGGWNRGSAIHFPGDRQLNETFLGSREEPKSEYNRVIKALKARLGDAFTVEEKV